MPDIAWKNLPPELATSFRPAGLPRWLVASLACLVAAAYLACVHGQWWPTSDSALYVGLGRSLLEGHGYQFNGEFCNEVTPGLPCLYALCLAVGGEHSFWLCHLAVTAAALVTLWLIYVVVSRLSDRTMALAVAVITAGSKMFFHSANQFLTDMPFMAVYWAMIYVAVRYLQSPRWKYLAVAGILAVLGMVLRLPGVTLVGPLAAGVLLQAGEVRLPRRLALASTLLVLAGGTWAAFHFLAHLGSPYVAHATKSLLDLPILSNPQDGFQGLALIVAWPVGSDPQMKSLSDIRVVLGLALLGVGGLGMLRMILRKQVLLPVTLLLSALVLLAIRDMTKMPDRYLMPVGPIMSLAVLYGLLWIVQAIFIAARWLWRQTHTGKLPAAARWLYRSLARLFRRSDEASAKYKFDIQPTCPTAPALPSAVQNSKWKTGSPRFSLGPTATWITAVLLVCLSLAANWVALSQRFLQHAYYGHTDEFLLHIGNGSFQGLTKMADRVKAIPASRGPVTCLYPDFRILHLLSRRVLVYQPLGSDSYDTLDGLRAFMDSKKSNYLVVGDEDDDENNMVVRQLVKNGAPLTADFQQLDYDHSCYLFERTAPISVEVPSAAPATGTAPSTAPATSTAP